MPPPYFIVENPVLSTLWHCYPMKSLEDDLDADRITVHLGGFGANTQKPLRLVGTVPYMGNVRRVSVQNKPPAGSLDTLADTAGGRVNGNKRSMVESSAYPMAFALLIATEHKHSIRRFAKKRNAFRTGLLPLPLIVRHAVFLFLDQ